MRTFGACGGCERTPCTPPGYGPGFLTRLTLRTSALEANMSGNKEETAEGGSLTRTLKETMIRPFWCFFQADNEFMVSVPV